MQNNFTTTNKHILRYYLVFLVTSLSSDGYVHELFTEASKQPAQMQRILRHNGVRSYWGAMSALCNLNSPRKILKVQGVEAHGHAKT